MGIYNENRPIACTYCGYGPIQGRESSYTDRTRGIITECRWTCSRCGKLVRCDEKVQPRISRENKEESNNDKKK